MKIYDPDSKRVLKNVTLFLTPQEAAELGDSANDLSRHPAHHHHHINDSEYRTEIVIAVYTDDNLRSFDEESRRVIKENS